MDDSFLKELDDEFSNVGSDEHWIRTILEKEVWFSPISFTDQSMINEKIAGAVDDLGFNTAWEMKRLTMACTIVGIGEKDLREYRNKPVFSIQDREGKKSKVILWKYVYEKIPQWGDTWLDAAFDVFADLMETHKKDCLKSIKFENNKPPTEELVELEIRAAELREELGKPPLMEADPLEGETASEPRKSEEPEGDTSTDFDPFKTVGTVSPKPVVPSSSESTPAETGSPAESSEDVGGYRRVQSPPQLDPVQTVPIPQPTPQSPPSPIQVAMAQQGKLSGNEAAQVLQAARQVVPPGEAQAILDQTDPHIQKQQAIPSTSSAQQPYRPSDSDEVLDTPAERKVIQPPDFNAKSSLQSKNPRFSPPGR